MSFTIVIPFWNGPSMKRMLDTIPSSIPVIIAVDKDSPQPIGLDARTKTINLDKRGYFSGTVNVGVNSCNADVLILNQDVWFSNNEWIEHINKNRDRYALIGDGVMNHPAWRKGYVQGTFMYIRRDAWERVGILDTKHYPLWGATCEWQLRVARNGFDALPGEVPGLIHAHRNLGQYGNAIAKAIMQEPDKQGWFVSKTPPEISVIIPCYNYGRYLKEAVDSVLAQTFQSFEIVIIDDCSTDDSWKTCLELHDPKKGIRVGRHEENKGTAATINTGINSCYGRYVTILSADDMFMPIRLERLYQEAVTHPHSVVYDDLIWRTTKGDKKVKLPDYFFDEYEGDADNHPGILNKNCMHAGILYPKRAWYDAGGYPEEMSDGREDWAFNVALGRVGYCGVHVKEHLYIYRREKQNRSLGNTTPMDHNRFLQKIMRLYPDVYNGDRKMGCCGSGRKNKGDKNTVNTKTPSPKAPLVGEGILLQYDGANVGTETWYGSKTGKRYKFGRNPQRRQGFVDPLDADGLMKSGKFRVIKVAQPKPVAAPLPKPVIVQEPIIEVEVVEVEAEEESFTQEEDAWGYSDEDFTEDEFATDEYSVTEDDTSEVNATNGAIQAAEELSIDLSEIENPTGKRISKRDVEEYARTIGLL